MVRVHEVHGVCAYVGKVSSKGGEGVAGEASPQNAEFSPQDPSMNVFEFS